MLAAGDPKEVLQVGRSSDRTLIPSSVTKPTQEHGLFPGVHQEYCRPDTGHRPRRTLCRLSHDPWEDWDGFRKPSRYRRTLRKECSRYFASALVIVYPNL